MTDAVAVGAWWARIEAREAAADDEPPFAAALERVHDHELAMRLADGERELGAALDDVCEGAWCRVADLLGMRLRVRRARHDELRQVADELRAFAVSVPDDEAATRGRAHHLLGVLHVRLYELDAAEGELVRALALVDSEPARTWVLDTAGQVLIGTGAWHEARRTLSGVADRKASLGDDLGVAISLGHLALMELKLGRTGEALRFIERAIAPGEALPPVTRMRLATVALQARLDSGAGALDADADALAALFAKVEAHPLKAYAAVALARAARARGDEAAVVRHLDAAAAEATLPALAALILLWKRRLDVDRRPFDAWLAEMEGHFDAVSEVTEVEVQTHLLLATDAARGGRPDEATAFVEKASSRAARSNNRLWIDWVDRVADELDPAGAPDRMARRLTGRRLADLERTRRAEATIVFADLVGFSARAERMEPDDVMATSRTVFELSASVLARHGVQPITYMGDGLLAVAEGEAHEERGLAFALEFTRRSLRASEVRRALGEEWLLESRAGVASGPVVLGLLGTTFKLDFAAIGHTTNLASRLQGQALPNEVVALYDTGRSRAAEAEDELVALKNIEGPVRVLRFRVRP